MGSRTQAISLVLLLAGCGHQPVSEPAGQPESVIALKGIKAEWLKPCEGLGDLTDHKVGDLLQDFTNAASLGATCQARHNSLIDYLGPLIQRLQHDPSPP